VSGSQTKHHVVSRIRVVVKEIAQSLPKCKNEISSKKYIKMFENLSKTINSINQIQVSEVRKEVLLPLVDYIQNKVKANQEIRLNFICTHNSRRSHLSQIWAQTMAFHFGIKNVFCYSGGTEATAMFPKVGETLTNQGFQIQQLSEGKNPVYAVKYDANEEALICFSKTFDDAFNPNSEFAAIMTCSSADEGCPFIAGAEKRLPIRYEDPKLFDGTNLMDAKYAERSLQIASEMYFVFSQINSNNS
jgi:arsenate reductase